MVALLFVLLYFGLWSGSNDSIAPMSQPQTTTAAVQTTAHNDTLSQKPQSTTYEASDPKVETSDTPNTPDDSSKNGWKTDLFWAIVGAIISILLAGTIP